MKKRRVKRDIDFLLNNKHYKRLHILLYFGSILIVVLTYFLTILFFSKFVNLILTTIISFIVGLYVVINRDVLVKSMSAKIVDFRRRKIKTKDKEGLKSTLQKIAPKNKQIIFKVKVPLKERLKFFKERKEQKSKKGYQVFK